jgi:hypothetical protein
LFSLIAVEIPSFILFQFRALLFSRQDETNSNPPDSCKTQAQLQGSLQLSASSVYPSFSSSHATSIAGVSRKPLTVSFKKRPAKQQPPLPVPSSMTTTMTPTRTHTPLLEQVSTALLKDSFPT